MLDCIVRSLPTDFSNILSQHFSGRSEGPGETTLPYVLPLRLFEVSLQNIVFYTPEQHMRRYDVLKYLKHLNTGKYFEINLFTAEGPCTEFQLCHRVSLNAGLSSSTRMNYEQIAYQLSRPNSEFGKRFPSLLILVNCFFWFRLCSENYSGLNLSPEADFQVTDVNWRFEKDKGEGVISYSAFASLLGRKEIRLDSLLSNVTTSKKSVLRNVLNLLSSSSSSKDSRNLQIETNFSNPSVLAGQYIADEEDVLYLEEVPTFEEKLTPHQSELLLQYLTTRSSRLSLVLVFFSHEDTVRALESKALRLCLVQCLFEGGQWNDNDVLLEKLIVPNNSQKFHGTAYGYLINDICYCPSTIIKALENILFYTYETEAERYRQDRSDAFLFSLYLIGRIYYFFSYLITAGNLEISLSTEARKLLFEAIERMESKINLQILPLLNRWLRHVRERDLKLKLFCHICILLSFCPLNESKCYYFLVTNISINNSDVAKTEDLTNQFEDFVEISLSELFLLFETQKQHLLRYLRQESTLRNTILQKVSEYVSLVKGNSEVEWVEFLSAGSSGLFIPSSEVALEEKQAKLTYEDWFIQRNKINFTTINVLTGEFSLRNQRLIQLETKISGNIDYRTITGIDSQQVGDNCFRVDEKRYFKRRRLVKNNYDVALWLPGQMLKYQYPYDTRPFPGKALSKNSILLEKVQSIIDLYFAGLEFSLLKSTITDEQVLGGFRPLGSEEPTLGNYPKIEIVINASSQCIAIYRIVLYGRRPLRVLLREYSDLYCFGAVAEFKNSTTEAMLKALASERDGMDCESVTIYKSIRNHRMQYIPTRFLYGLVPQVLLSQRHFWQDCDTGSLEGVPVDQLSETLVLRPSLGNESKRLARIEVCVEKVCQNGTQWRLLNLANPCPTQIESLKRVFLHLEDLSGILCWYNECDRSANFVFSLPNLDLRFSTKEGDDSKFYFDRFPGYYVVTDQQLLKLYPLGKVPRTVLLQNTDGNMAVLVASNIFPSVENFRSNDFSTQFIPRNPVKTEDNYLQSKSFIYRIHSSLQFHFSGSVLASLFLFYLYVLTREYKRAFATINSCVYDEKLTPDMFSIVKSLNQFSLNADASAAAVRLKYFLVNYSNKHMLPQWNIKQDIMNYISNLRTVLPECRLAVPEELFLLGEFKETTSSQTYELLLENRTPYLLALDLSGRKDMRSQQLMFSGRVPQNSAISTKFGRTSKRESTDHITSGSIETFLKRSNATTMLQYRRPVSSLISKEALSYYDALLSQSKHLTKPGSGISFLLLYELFTNSRNLRILEKDSTEMFASILFFLSGEGKIIADKTLYGMLKIICVNPFLKQVLVKYDDERKHKIAIMFKGQKHLSGIFSGFEKIAIEQKNLLKTIPYELKKSMLSSKWPVRMPIKTSPSSKRLFVVSSFSDTSCSRVNFAISSFQFEEKQLRKPLGFLDDSLFQCTKNNIATGIDFEVAAAEFNSTKASRSPLAKQIFGRILQDFQSFSIENKDMRSRGVAQKQFEVKETDMVANRLKTLETMYIVPLKKLREGKLSAVQEWTRDLVASLNSSQTTEALIRKFGKVCATERDLGFQDICQALLSSKGSKWLKRIDPGVNPEAMFQRLTIYMLQVNQLGLAMKVLALCHEIKQVLESGIAEEQNISLMLLKLQKEVNQTRTYFNQTDLLWSFDPRLLMFEFIEEIVLRKGQVQLLRQISKNIEDGKSSCRQMLMGEGIFFFIFEYRQDHGDYSSIVSYVFISKTIYHISRT
eukprot:augustus_masked-scaffold_10-processed-gene-12.1-mRNA-1 protein AED:0.94 eAED:0.96 QI:0/-1/0/1/-1/1/1/0/1752